MRLPVIIIALLGITYVVSAKHKSKIDEAMLMDKEWIGPGGEYLRITKETAIVHARRYFQERNEWKARGDLLILTNRERGSDNKEYTYNDSFIVERLTADTLILQSVRTGSRRAPKLPLMSGEPIGFVSNSVLTKAPFSFQGIFFSFSGGWGPCRKVQIAIDSVGAIRVAYGPGNCGKFKGTYKGMLSAGQLQRLGELVNKSVPDRFDIRGHADDGGSTEFKFRYNDKVREAYGQGWPYLANDLATFLQTIPEKMITGRMSVEIMELK